MTNYKLLVFLLALLPQLAQSEERQSIPYCDDLPKTSWCGMGSSQLCRNKSGEAFYVARCTVDIMNQYCHRVMTIEQCLHMLQSRVDAPTR